MLYPAHEEVDSGYLASAVRFMLPIFAMADAGPVNPLPSPMDDIPPDPPPPTLLIHRLPHPIVPSLHSLPTPARIWPNLDCPGRRRRRILLIKVLTPQVQKEL
jgi:hypothetical protein